jgi:hypothetical protein
MDSCTLSTERTISLNSKRSKFLPHERASKRQQSSALEGNRATATTTVIRWTYMLER